MGGLGFWVNPRLCKYIMGVFIPYYSILRSYYIGGGGGALRGAQVNSFNPYSPDSKALNP